MVANELIYHFTDVILQRHETTGGLPTPRHYRPQRSWGKVMFLHVSVILFTVGRGDWEDNPLGRHPPPSADTPANIPPPWADIPVAQCMLGYGQQTGGTHPTGMQSCFVEFSRKFKTYRLQGWRTALPRHPGIGAPTTRSSASAQPSQIVFPLQCLIFALTELRSIQEETFNSACHVSKIQAAELCVTAAVSGTEYSGE